MWYARFAAAGALALALGCSLPRTGLGTSDAGGSAAKHAPDGGPDAPDAFAPDAAIAPIDTGPLDTGPPDAGPPDTGLPDSGPPDTGPPDTGPPSCESL